MIEGARLVSDSGDVAYVGWLGHDNLGDEVIANAWRSATQRRLRPLGGGRPAAVLRRRWSPPAALIGGGTVVGHPGFRQMVEPVRHLAVVAVGVEAPAFFGRREGEAWLELERWAAVLGRSERASVRGPRSQQLLAAVGLDLPIVPDMALVSVDPGDPTPQDRVLGVNIGSSWGSWHEEAPFVDEVANAMTTLAGDGWTARVLVVCPLDSDLGWNLARRVPSAELVLATTADKYLAEARRCQVVVAQKLHAIVLAAAAGVPTVAMEYHPKCADHMDLLGRMDLLVRTDQVRADDLVQRVKALAADAPDESSRLREASVLLQQRAVRELAATAAWLTVPR